MNECKVSTRVVVEVTPPSVEPVSVAEARLHSRITQTDEDSLVAIWISAARRYCEQYLQRALCPHIYRADLPGWFDFIDLPYKPIAEIRSVNYYDTSSPSVLTALFDSTSSPLVTTEVFDVIQGNIVRNTGQTFPDVYPRLDAVQITYQAGYGSSPITAIPQSIKQAMLLLIGDCAVNREAVISGTIVTENKAVERLLNPERVYR